MNSSMVSAEKLRTEKEECDLIVLGSHGKGFLEHAFLGSVSRMVLDRARKPVFIVPLPSGEVDMGWGKGGDVDEKYVSTR